MNSTYPMPVWISRALLPSERRLEGGIYDKYNSDIACSLPGIHKLYNKLIAYQIFEIGFDIRRQWLKIDFEDLNENFAILRLFFANC